MTKHLRALLFFAPVAVGCGSVASSDPTAADIGGDPGDTMTVADTAVATDTTTTPDTRGLADAVVAADSAVGDATATDTTREAGAPGIECAADRCLGMGDGCVICRPGEATPTPFCSMDFFAGECKTAGFYPPLRMLCDGTEDCKSGERCVLYEGSVGTYTVCQGLDGGAGGISVVCRTLADCPLSAKTCEPYHPAEGGRAAYPVNVCRS